MIVSDDVSPDGKTLLITSDEKGGYRNVGLLAKEAAGVDVFYQDFERRMDALLHPDYSDEEIRREVRNFGITENAQDKALGLEEKGTVYNEMVSSMDQPTRRLYSTTLNLLYGQNHPLQFVSGGTPEALRQLTPADIRTFHAAHYFLANMGAIVSVPQEVSLDSVLQKLDAMLTRAFWPLYRFRLRVAASFVRPKPSLPQRIVEASHDE